MDFSVRYRRLSVVVLAAFWLALCPWHAAHVTAAEPAPAPDEQPKSAARSAAEIFCRDKSPAELVALLGHDQFQLRQCAEEQLFKQLPQAPPERLNEIERACYTAYRSSDNPELRMRARAVLTQFATNHWSPESFLGVAVTPDSTFDDAGKVVSRLKISRVADHSPAARARIRPDDVIQGVDSLTFNSAGADKVFQRYLSKKAPGQTLLLHMERGDQKREVSVVLERKPRSQSRDENGTIIPPDPQKCLREYLGSKHGDP